MLHIVKLGERAFPFSRLAHHFLLFEVLLLDVLENFDHL